MTLIQKLSSLLDARVAAEADWQRMSRAVATAATEFEHQRLVARWTGADGGPGSARARGAGSVNLESRS